MRTELRAANSKTKTQSCQTKLHLGYPDVSNKVQLGHTFESGKERMLGGGYRMSELFRRHMSYHTCSLQYLAKLSLALHCCAFCTGRDIAECCWAVLHDLTLLCIALSCVALPCIAHLCCPLYYITSLCHRDMLQCIGSHCFSLPGDALHSFALHRIKLPCFSLLHIAL